MNDTLKSILRILDEERAPELKIAAAQVLGQIKARDPAVTSSLARELEEGEDYLARHVLTALAAIGSDSSIRVLVGQLGRSDQADLTAHLLADVGKEAAPVLAEVFDTADGETRARILGILGRLPGRESLQVLEKALAIPELSHSAGAALSAARLEALDKRSGDAFKARLSKTLRTENLAPQCVATMLGVLARLDGATSRPTLLKYAAEDQPAMVRRAALEALSGLRLSPSQAGTLLEMLGDPDQVNVVEPALKALRGVEAWPEQTADRLRKLVASKNESLRLFALRALCNAPTAESVKLLIHNLQSEDSRFRDAAAIALGHNPHALDPMLRVLLKERDLGRARRLIAPLATHGAAIDDAKVKSLVERGCRLLGGQDPRGELLLDLVVRARSAAGIELLVDKAIRLRRQRRLGDAIGVLAFLAAGDHLDDEGRYQLALTRLLFDAKNNRAGAETPGDATMGYIARLVRNGFPVGDRLRKEGMLRPEDLVRVGEHFSEGVGDERRFGTELLRHVADKHSRARVGEEARSRLKAVGY